MSNHMVPSPALNPAADDARISFHTTEIALLSKIADLEGRIDRLSLTNRKLRDRLKELVDHLADFGVYVQP